MSNNNNQNEKAITMLNLVLFGPPGSGKGTQAKFLMEKYKLDHTSTGDMLRAQIAANSDLGLEAKSYMDKGELVPDSVIIGMIADKLDKKSGEVAGFIFDGFPRTVAQAKALDQLLQEKGMGINKMLALQVDDEELTTRLLERGKSSGRSDDTSIETIQNRIQVYKSKTTPVADYYFAQGKGVYINGVGAIEEITQALCSEIDALLVA
ncbi:MAG: adenylate kinase [Chitinophagales bacterium]